MPNFAEYGICYSHTKMVCLISMDYSSKLFQNTKGLIYCKVNEKLKKQKFI